MIKGPLSDADLEAFFVEKPSQLPDFLTNRVAEINQIFDDLQKAKTDESISILELHTKFHTFHDEFKKELVKASVSMGIRLTEDAADDILTYTGSFLRGRLLIDLKNCVTEDEWLKLFFDNWPRIEIGDEYISELKEIFKDADCPALMKKYASESSYEEYLKMPDTISVMRGCSTNSIDGLSWTTDLEVAKFFAKRRFDLFSRNGLMVFRLISDIRNEEDRQKYLNLPYEDTYIAFGEVQKNDCLFFGDRGEIEVFSSNVLIYDTEQFDSIEEIELYDPSNA